MKIIIAGGGIGGLVTALSLHQAGFDPYVFESVEQVRPLGVGINLLPHAVRVLTNLGLHQDLAKIAVETRELVYANRFGQFFWEELRGKFAGYKWPQYSIHRGEFQYLLWRITEQTLGPGRLFSGFHAIGSNGASQAILDAEALTRALTAQTNPLAALETYEKERLPATAQVVRQNRQKGPDFIMDLMEERFPEGFTKEEIPQAELAQIMDKYKKIAGFDIESLNSKS